jgi:hypothetical protein
VSATCLEYVHVYYIVWASTILCGPLRTRVRLRFVSLVFCRPGRLRTMRFRPALVAWLPAAVADWGVAGARPGPRNLSPAGNLAPASLCVPDADWSLVWEDDFDKPTGLDPSVWTVPVGVGNAFGRTANVTIEDTYVRNGTLVLRSRKLADGTFTSGAAMTSSQGPAVDGPPGKNWQYGRFCITAILPGAGRGKSQGLWPAHWMMPSDYSKHCGYVRARGCSCCRHAART